jgi:tetratricopeptide (TPR) repeat protein
LAFSCLFIVFSTRAQQNSLHVADSLEKRGEYRSAATAFERVYFFSGLSPERIRALFSRADCFRQLGQYYEAYSTLVRINNFEVSDSLKCAANYQLALYLYLSGYFNDAEKYCARNYSIPVNTAEFKSTLLLHTLVFNELHQYPSASGKAIEYIQSLDIPASQKDSLSAFVHNSYHASRVPRLKSLKKARRLSKVIPGAGLFYAGKPGKAMANIGFQLMAAGYTGANIYVGNYITAASAGLFLMRSFYTGGINQLNEVVPDINYRRARKFNDNFKSSFISQIKKTQ